MCRMLFSVLVAMIIAIPAAAQSDEELRQGAEAIVRSLQDSWNARDAKRWADNFSSRHDYVAIGGMLLSDLTPQQNASGHAELWNGRFSEGSRITLDLVSVTKVASNVALGIVRNRNEFSERGLAKSHTSVISMVLVTEAGRWRIRQFNNNLQASQ